MPKQPSQVKDKAQLYAREFPREFCTNPNLFCMLCCQTVNCDKRFRVESHRSSSKHKRLLTTTAGKTVQQTLLPNLKTEFKCKIVDAFLAADIPLHKLHVPQIRQLFTDLGQPVPSETTCRKHVENLATDQLQRLKEKIHGKNVFLVVDESEINGAKYLNILLGDTAVPDKTYVLECSVVEVVNQQVITAAIDDALKKLDIQRRNFVLLLSDAARYMTASTAALKILYPRLFHVTCMAHLVHNCAEKVRSHFKNVDDLIATVKAVTLKNKNRSSKFSDIGSPPHPVLTRWGTWLIAVEYYAKNLLEVREIVNSFEGAGILVRRAQAAVNDQKVAESLAMIQRDYSALPSLIKKMENSKYTIQEAHNDIANLDLKQDCVGIAAYIKKRMEKNCDIHSIVRMQKEDVCPALYAELQCCQPTSASVERSFSMLAKLLRKDRNFLPENVGKYFRLYYNKL